MNCRYCNENLDDGDIYQVLSKNDLYKNYSKDELLKIAECYGYSIDNPKHFTKVIIVQFEDKPQIEICPFCNGIWPQKPDMPREYYS